MDARTGLAKTLDSGLRKDQLSFQTGKKELVEAGTIFQILAGTCRKKSLMLLTLRGGTLAWWIF